MRVEPLEFTSSGGRGEALSRQVKRHFMAFYEGVIMDKCREDKKDER